MSAQQKRIILTPIEEEAEQEELKISPIPFILAGAAIVGALAAAWKIWKELAA